VKEFTKDPFRGYGANVITVFADLTNENCKEPYGPATRQFNGNGSYGNGGAMRVSPAALFTVQRTPEEVDVITPVASILYMMLCESQFQYCLNDVHIVAISFRIGSQFVHCLCSEFISSVPSYNVYYNVSILCGYC